MTVNRKAATARARQLIGDGAEPYPHDELDLDRDAGGYAFKAGTSFAVIGFHGGYVTALLGFGDRTVDNVVAEWLEEERGRERPRASSWGPSQQLALDAVAASVPVASLAGDAPPGIVDHAEYVAIVLRRSVDQGGEAARALSEATYLTAPPVPGRTYTHPCPVDGTPAVHEDSYPRSVCTTCSQRAADGDGRRVAAFSERLSGGGLIVFYADSADGTFSEVAEEVTASGRCWVDGHPCLVTEARFGGVVIQTIDG